MKTKTEVFAILQNMERFQEIIVRQAEIYVSF